MAAGPLWSALLYRAGEALVVIDGVACKAHYLVVDLPHSDDACW